MKLTRWLLAAIVLCAMLSTLTAAETKKPPNILFLLTDDQRPDTIHALGNSLIDTPNLDRLVRSGTSFTRAVSPNPLCVPSRAEILTGCSGFRNGVSPPTSNRLDGSLKTWPQTLRDSGYHTWYVGKWHTTGKARTVGYEESQGLFAGGKGPTAATFDDRGREITGYRGWVFQTEDGRLFPEKGVGLTPGISADLADAAIGFIRRRPEKPFFLHVNFTAPHDPLLLPPGYERKYDPNKLLLPLNYLPEHPFDHGNLRGRDELLLPFPRTPALVRDELARYYAVISHLDEQIGRILKTLDDTDQASRTVIIFSSDHGLAIGSHGLRGKQNMYEHTVGVPLIVSGPGIPKNEKCAAQVYLRDLFPTACELAGIAAPATVEGRSLVPLLTGRERELYPEVYGYFMNVQRMVRTDRWKLIEYPQVKRWQLFDLQADPHEKSDLYGDPRHAAVIEDLRGRLRRWQARSGDPLK